MSAAATEKNGHAMPPNATALAANQADGLPLLPAHRNELIDGSGLAIEVIREAGIYSETDEKRLSKLLGMKWDKSRCGNALIFPYFDCAGNLVLARAKPDRPLKLSKNRAAKYVQPAGTPTRCYVVASTRVAINTPKAAIAITEGEKKTLAILQAGLPCIGLTGVNSWHQPDRKGEPKDPLALRPELEEIDWRERPVYIVFDSDAATNADVHRETCKLAAAIQAKGAIVRVARIPPAEGGGKQGADDFLVAAGRDKFRELIAGALPPDPPPATTIIDCISNGEEIEVDTPNGPTTTVEPFKMPDIIDAILHIANRFPKRVGRSLFVHDSHGLSWLDKPAALFGWLGHLKQVKWYQKTGFVTKEELFHELQRTAESFDAIESLPHEPPMRGHFYAGERIESGSGEHLEKLVSFFRPETTADREAIRAMFVTPGWGGRPGSWPAFVITSEAGRGVGKTKLAEFLSRLWGGAIDVSLHENIDALKSRLLSAEAIVRRVAVIDNTKASVVSWANLEALTTAATISGKRLYHGEGTRPNTLTWVITLNGPALSADLAQRSVIIRLVRGDNPAEWGRDVATFIDEHREAILADIVGFLRRPIADPPPLARYTRWAAWEEAVLSRVNNPAEVQAVIAERQRACDADSDEMDIVEDFFRDQLSKLRYDPERESVRIPVAVVARWHNWATGDGFKVAGVSRRLKQAADEGQLACLQPDTSRTYGRCFIWTGEHCDASERIQNDLQHRLTEAGRHKDGKDSY